MLYRRLPWQQELDIIDRVMKDVSDVRDPEEMVGIYWNGIHELLPVEDFVAISRRGLEHPEFLVTRSSRFTEHFNPWTQRDRLPRLRGGLLSELAYANRPEFIEDLPARLAVDDPARIYLEGFQAMVALPHYEGREAMNLGCLLFRPGVEIDRSVIPVMHWQSGLFGRGTQNLVLRNQLDAALRELDRELEVVGDLQRALLPQVLPAIPGFEVSAYYQSSARAGGDSYDFFPLGDDDWGVFIADVSGHGAAAAVLMAVTHAIAHSRPGMPTPPCELLAHLNHHLARSYTMSGSFVTAFYAALDVSARTLTYATAGHNPPRLLRGNRVTELRGTVALPLGIVGEEVYRDEPLLLERGDLLLLYTDGITEAMAPPDAEGRRDLFGTERLDRVLLAHGDRPTGELLATILREVETFTRGAAASDDRTLVALRCVE